MTPFGWRLLGGPHAKIGTDRLTRLGWWLAWLLILVSAVDVLTGRWLLQGERRGAVLALATTPASLLLGRVFVLPYLIAMAPIRALLTLVAWPRLRRSRGPAEVG
jgi:hypothetical protein